MSASVSEPRSESSSPRSIERFDDLMIRSAWLYHQRGWTQEQIAQKFRVSRATVARLLQRAVQEGLVRVWFAPDAERLMILEEDLCKRYALEEAILVPCEPTPTARQSALARATAAYLERALEDGMVVALGTSRTLHEMASIFSPSRKMPGCVFVEMSGGVAAEDPRFDTYNVSWQLARACGGTARHLFTPAVLSSARVKQAISSDPRVAETLQLAANSDMSLLAIGDTIAGCPMFEMARMSQAEIDQLRARGAVGEIIGRAYDINGNAVSTSIDDRYLGLTLEQIRKLRFVVAVAGTVTQPAAILGALRQGFIKVMIMDYQTGRALLESD